MLQVGPAATEELAQVARLAQDVLGADGGWLHEGDACLVAKDAVSERVVGFAVARREPCCEAHLLALAVEDDRQGEGVGSALLRYTQDLMYRSGARSMHLEVRPDNAHAQAFYARQGYAPTGLHTQMYPDGADALVMQRPL